MLRGVPNTNGVRPTLRGISVDLGFLASPRPVLKNARLNVFIPIGLLGGLFGGLLGIGGGSVMSPLLLLSRSLPPAQVAGTTLASVLVISIVGSGTYASLGHLNLGLAWPIAVGSVLGCVLGALMSKRLSIGVMTLMFLAILPYFALNEFWPSLAAPDIPLTTLPLVFLGFAAGLLGGLLGISGASLVVPSLVAFFLIDHHAAQGIAMSVALADSVAGVITHARRGNVNYRALMSLAPIALVAALTGAFLSHYLPEPALRILFGGFMTAVSLMMLGRLVGGLIESRSVAPSPCHPKESA